MKFYTIYLHSRRIPKTSVGEIITSPTGYLSNTLQIEKKSEKSIEAVDGIFWIFFLSFAPLTCAQ